MKILLTQILLIMSLGVCSKIYTQTFPPIGVKVNFLSPIMGAATLHIEAGLNEKNSINIVPSAGFRNFEGNGVQGWGISAEWRYYPNDTVFAGGFYFAPYIRYRDIQVWGDYTEVVNGDTIINEKRPIPFNTIGGGIIFGKQWLFGKQILLDLFAGPAINSKSFKDAPTQNDVILQNLATTFWIRSGVTIGYKI